MSTRDLIALAVRYRQPGSKAGRRRALQLLEEAVAAEKAERFAAEKRCPACGYKRRQRKDLLSADQT